MSTLIIGFGNKARHGKDTAVKAILESYLMKYDVRRYAFGDELKKEVNELDQFEWCMRYGIPYDTNPPMDDPLCTTKHGKQNRLLQWYGTEYRRKQDPFYWVKVLRNQLEQDKPQIALISDLRFWNEYAFTKSMGGYTVKVTRVGFEDLTRDAQHRSETELDTVVFDYHIQCLDGEVEQLRKDALYVFEDVLDMYQPKIPQLPVVELYAA